jgi:hypothetical protein
MCVRIYPFITLESHHLMIYRSFHSPESIGANILRELGQQREQILGAHDVVSD